MNRAGSDTKTLLLLSLAGGLFSLLVTGYVFGISNNAYHLAIVSSLYDEPQFANDAYTQSLRYFASGLWMLLRGAAAYCDPNWLFLAGLYISRVIAFAGFLACARLLGVTTLKQRLYFIIILSFTGLLYGESYAGGGGLFINYFTHSEIANGLSLLCLSWIIRGRLLQAHIANGGVFFLNAFIAVWNAVPMALLMLGDYLQKKVTLKRFLTENILGVILFLLIALPVLLNIFSNPEFGKKPDYNYIDLLNQYWPYHTLFAATSFKQKIAAALIIAIGFASFHRLGQQGRPFSLALAGYCLVYAAGIIAPHVTGSPVILNLHLLRVSTFFHLLAALGATSLAVTWLTRDEAYFRCLLAPALVLLLCTHKLVLATAFFIAIAPLAIIHKLTPATLIRQSAKFAGVLVVVWGIMQGVIVNGHYAANADKTKQVAEFAAVGNWAKSHTPPDAIFLIMTADPRPWAIPNRPFQQADFDSTIFQYASHRQTWTDFKDGAAALWSPSFYHIWSPRITEVLALATLAEKKAYAQRNGIAYLVDSCESPHTALFASGNICLYSAE